MIFIKGMQHHLSIILHRLYLCCFKYISPHLSLSLCMFAFICTCIYVYAYISLLFSLLFDNYAIYSIAQTTTDFLRHSYAAANTSRDMYSSGLSQDIITFYDYVMTMITFISHWNGDNIFPSKLPLRYLNLVFAK